MDNNNQIIAIQQHQALDLVANQAEPHPNTVLNPPANKAKYLLKSAKAPPTNT